MSLEKAENKNVNAAKVLLDYYGHDSLAYFSLNQKKKYFFSSTGKSFLAYIIISKVALISGDPIGSDTDIQLLVKEFSYFMKGAKLSTCFVGIHEKSLPLLDTLHHKVIHAGDEAIVNLQNYQKQALKRKVRRAENHLKKKRIICEIYSRKDLPSHYSHQINHISQEWLLSKGGKERGFSMTLGRIPGCEDENCIFVIAIQEKSVLGFLTFMPSCTSQTLSLDMSRRKIDAPNGLTEFLLINAFDYYKEKNVKYVSLNFATFYKHNLQHTYSVNKLLVNWIYKGLSLAYRTNRLYNFNEKFLPQWQSRYIVFEKKRHLPRYLLAIAKTELNI